MGNILQSIVIVDVTLEKNKYDTRYTDVIHNNGLLQFISASPEHATRPELCSERFYCFRTCYATIKPYLFVAEVFMHSASKHICAGEV